MTPSLLRRLVLLTFVLSLFAVAAALINIALLVYLSQ